MEAAVKEPLEVTYTMPPAYVGLDVWWFKDSNRSDPVAAKVTKLGERTLCLWILPPGTHNGMPKDGVKHLSDPVKREYDRTQCGFWDYIPAKVVGEVRAFMVKSAPAPHTGPQK